MTASSFVGRLIATLPDEAKQRELTAPFTKQQDSYDGSSELATLPLPDNSRQKTAEACRHRYRGEAVTRW